MSKYILICRMDYLRQGHRGYQETDSFQFILISNTIHIQRFEFKII